MIADATGAPNAISMPSTLARDSIRKLPANIHTIPAIAMPIASQVRGAMGERSTAHARNAVVSGATARTISVFAVDVSVSASMKQTNIVAHIAPDSSPGPPARRIEPTKSRRTKSRNPATVSAAKKLRQNVISNRPSACSSGDR